MFRAAVAGPQNVARVVDDERVGNHQVATSENRGPVRQIVAVAVRIVEETSFLDDQRPGVDAHFPAIPTFGPRAGGFFDGSDRAFDRLTLLVLGHFVVVAPAITVAGYLVAP